MSEDREIGKIIGFIGSGNMAEALIRGLLENGVVETGAIFCFDIVKERLDYLAETFGVKTTEDIATLTDSVDIIIISTKPSQVVEVINHISGRINKDKLIISIAAGITLDFIQSRVEKGIPVIRVMPNITALVHEGMSALAPGPYVDEKDMNIALSVFGGVGEAVVVEEGLIDAVTALSGSGPAYIFLVIEAMADGGVMAGLSRPLALKLSAQTVLGAAKMVLETGMHPGELKDMVASPAGSTISGLSALEENGVRGAIMEAVDAAYQRAKELKGGD